MLVGIVLVVGGVELLVSGLGKGLGDVLGLAHEQVCESVVVVHVPRVTQRPRRLEILTHVFALVQLFCVFVDGWDSLWHLVFLARHQNTNY